MNSHILMPLISAFSQVRRFMERVLRGAATVVCAVLAFGAARGAEGSRNQPNIVLIMADDLGYGDVAYNGNPKVKTPALDRLSRESTRFDRFYAGAPVCTPTRATVLTGRNPNRCGAEWAGDYPLPLEEKTIAEYLREAGYRTGHFGKWHLGKMTPDRSEGFGEKNGPETYVAPWHQGFETCFSTESATPNYNPAVWGREWDLNTRNPDANLFVMNRPIVYGEGTLTGEPMKRWPFDFWLGEGRKAPDVIAGDSSELIVNHAERFILDAARDKQPFLAVVWFVTPHSPVAAGPEFRALYPDLTIQEQHWFGAISALDSQVDRIVSALRRSGVEDNTILWFCSDNGPSWVHNLNSAGPLRGKKSELYEGGIRVPAFIRWPAGLSGSSIVNVPVSTNDMLPTLLAAVGRKPSPGVPLDGENVLPLLRGKVSNRGKPLFFDYPYRDLSNVSWVPTKQRQYAVIDGTWKLISVDDGKSYQLYDLEHDIGERSDVSARHGDRVVRMKAALKEWQQSCRESKSGADYRPTAAGSRSGK